MTAAVLFGTLPDWAKGSGYGDGSGYGYGSGYGDGYGDGYGSGDGSGYGYGYGYGYGDGSGYGYGYGDGSGYGYGSGSGSGSGDGSGDGYGDGYGYGDGSGSGYGSGSGDGDGYGDGYGEYWASCVKYFAEKWPVEQIARLKAAMAEGCKIAYWRSDAKGKPANGGRMTEAAAPGLVQEIKGPLELCGSGALHATLLPPRWKGSRWWVVALHGEVKGDDEKFGALKREIIGECL